MTADSSTPATTLSSIKSTADALVKPGETELQRWRRTFDKFATTEEAGKK